MTLSLAPEMDGVKFSLTVLEKLQALALQEDWEAAQTEFEQLHTLYTESAELWYLWGQLLSRTQPEAAKQAYQVVLSHDPQHGGAHNNLGVLAEQNLDYETALNHYHQAFASEPQNRQYLYNLAQNYLHLDDQYQAMYYTRELLKLSPDWASTYTLLAVVLESLGQFEQAIAGYKQALSMDEQQTRAAYQLGQLYQKLRHYPDAIAIYTQLIWQQNQNPTHLDRPLLANTYNLLAFCEREQGQISAAIHAYQQSLNLYPLDSTRVALALFLPPYYRNHEDLAQWRKFFEQGLVELESFQNQMGDPISEVVNTPFYLAYQGQNDRALLERLGNFYQHFLPSEIVLNTQLPSEKIRVGFVSNCFYDHSISDYYAGLILNLPRERFEIYLFTTTLMPADAVTAALRQRVDGFYQVPPQLESLRRVIAQETLDILIYPEIGIDPVSYFLAATRLAPVQAVLQGHPVTSGLKTIDYFLSSQTQEPPEAEAHYTEKLMRFSRIPAYYQRPPLPDKPKTRKELQLPNLGNVYLCAQTLYKLHPDFDACLQEILDLDRKAFILFFYPPGTVLHTYLQERFQNSIPRKNHRIKFLPRMNLTDFFSCLLAADVVLDTPHFGGGSTAYQAFAMGAPIVTWPGEFLRGRTTAALYQQMGIAGGIAPSLAEYAPMAVKIATDRSYREALVREIQTRSPLIFEDKQVIVEVMDWLESVID